MSCPNKENLLFEEIISLRDDLSLDSRGSRLIRWKETLHVNRFGLRCERQLTQLGSTRAISLQKSKVFTITSYLDSIVQKHREIINLIKMSKNADKCPHLLFQATLDNISKGFSYAENGEHSTRHALRQ